MSSLATVTPGGAAQFWRSYEVTLDNGDGTALVYGNVHAGAANIRAAFSVERTQEGSSSRTLTLTNLSPASIRNIRASALGITTDETLTPGTGTRVNIKVGYGGALSTLFVGAVSKCRTERNGADVHTHVEMIDAESFTLNCIFSKSYAAAAKGVPPVRLTQIIRDIVDAMQVSWANKTIRVISGVAFGVPIQTYPQGIGFNGTCGDALKTVLKPLGLQFNVFNGALSIVPVSGHLGGEAVVMRPDTGLINEPSPDINKGFQIVHFQSLMNVRLQPHSLVVFGGAKADTTTTGVLRATDAFPGYFKVIRATYKGDTHGADWTVDCEALPYDGIVQQVPT